MPYITYAAGRPRPAERPWPTLRNKESPPEAPRPSLNCFPSKHHVPLRADEDLGGTLKAIKSFRAPSFSSWITVPSVFDPLWNGRCRGRKEESASEYSFLRSWRPTRSWDKPCICPPGQSWLPLCALHGPEEHRKTEKPKRKKTVRVSSACGNGCGCVWVTAF